MCQATKESSLSVIDKYILKIIDEQLTYKNLLNIKTV